MVVVDVHVQSAVKWSRVPELERGDLRGWQRVELMLHDYLDGEPYMAGPGVETPVYV